MGLAFRCNLFPLPYGIRVVGAEKEKIPGFSSQMDTNT
jgi:hypothetical protein